MSKTKNYKVRILAAVIEEKEDGDGEAKPVALDIPVVATSFEAATKVVLDAIIALIPRQTVGGTDSFKELAKYLEKYEHSKLQEQYWAKPQFTPEPQRSSEEKTPERKIIELWKKFMKD